MKKTLIALFIIGLLILPVLSLAYETPSTPPTGNLDIPTVIGYILTIMYEIAFGLGVIMFIVAGILFMTSQGAPEKVSTARSAALWAVVGIVVAIIAFSLDSILAGIGLIS